MVQGLYPSEKLRHNDLKAIVFNLRKGFIGNNRVLLEKGQGAGYMVLT